eukprot:scaffold22447_cov70-Phaeocystis_antarctica.AAC.6
MRRCETALHVHHTRLVAPAQEGGGVALLLAHHFLDWGGAPCANGLLESRYLVHGHGWQPVRGEAKRHVHHVELAGEGLSGSFEPGPHAIRRSGRHRQLDELQERLAAGGSHELSHEEAHLADSHWRCALAGDKRGAHHLNVSLGRHCKLAQAGRHSDACPFAVVFCLLDCGDDIVRKRDCRARRRSMVDPAVLPKADLCVGLGSPLERGNEVRLSEVQKFREPLRRAGRGASLPGGSARRVRHQSQSRTAFAPRRSRLPQRASVATLAREAVLGGCARCAPRPWRPLRAGAAAPSSDRWLGI